MRFIKGNIIQAKTGFAYITLSSSVSFIKHINNTPSPPSTGPTVHLWCHPRDEVWSCSAENNLEADWRVTSCLHPGRWGPDNRTQTAANVGFSRLPGKLRESFIQANKENNARQIRWLKRDRWWWDDGLPKLCLISKLLNCISKLWLLNLGTFPLLSSQKKSWLPQVRLYLTDSSQKICLD